LKNQRINEKLEGKSNKSYDFDKLM